MESSREFLGKVLDSITEHIVVIDETGDIQFVNRSWTAFGSSNACVIGDDWRGVNYMDECDKASSMGDKFGTQAAAGIRSVVEKREKSFYLEYPCHSPDEKRWFMMRITPFVTSGKNFFVISHQNITERKLAEEEVQKLARLDGLTNIPNRRAFDEFLSIEWRRCARLKKPICMAMIDLDHFKLLNDEYGHLVGDDCLIRVGNLLKEFGNRPEDFCARYGGEEFVLIWGDTSLEKAKQLATEILARIVDFNIQNLNSATKPYLTASIGVAQMMPNAKNEAAELIGKADDLLYKAKIGGRNRVEC